MLAPPLSHRSERHPKTFITEMKSAQQYSVPSTKANSNKPKKSLSMLPTLINKKPIYHHDEVDQCKLDHLYEILVSEIISLKKEIMPIRNRYLRLKDHLLFQNKCATNSNLLFAEHVPTLSNAVKEGTFSSVIGQFQEQSDMNTEEMMELHQQLSHFSVIKLSCEVDAARNELLQMRKNIKMMKEQKDEMDGKIADLRSSNIQHEVQRTKDKIRTLIVQISRAENHNLKLANLENKLIKEVPDVSPEYQDAFNELQELSKQLTLKRQEYFTKCNELIEERERQMQEIQVLEKSKAQQNQLHPIAEPEKPSDGVRKKPTLINQDIESNFSIFTDIEEIPLDQNSEKSEKEWVTITDF